MRLATELVPAVSAIITPRLFSPFWVVIFYFTMIVFGLAQQMALFHTVSSGLIAIKSDYFLQFESSLIFISCLLGLIFCFPLATEVIYSCCSCNVLLSFDRLIYKFKNTYSSFEQTPQCDFRYVL